jgi:hypothetical protein
MNHAVKMRLDVMTYIASLRSIGPNNKRFGGLYIHMDRVVIS